LRQYKINDARKMNVGVVKAAEKWCVIKN
jgi:hypothetical protein